MLSNSATCQACMHFCPICIATFKRMSPEGSRRWHCSSSSFPGRARNPRWRGGQWAPKHSICVKVTWRIPFPPQTPVKRQTMQIRTRRIHSPSYESRRKAKARQPGRRANSAPRSRCPVRRPSKRSHDRRNATVRHLFSVFVLTPRRQQRRRGPSGSLRMPYGQVRVQLLEYAPELETRQRRTRGISQADLKSSPTQDHAQAGSRGDLRTRT